MKIRFLIACALALAACTQTKAGDCIKNQDGNVVCGEGQCAVDGGALRFSRTVFPSLLLAGTGFKELIVNPVKWR
ncbi:MAG: hypothetical protein ABI607_02905 [Betaproteobacteria bacterium]